MMKEIVENEIKSKEISEVKEAQFFNNISSGEINNFEKADKSLAEIEKRKMQINKLQDKYKNQLTKLSDYPQSLNNSNFKEWEKINPSEIGRKRIDFKLNKESLINNWEKSNNKNWPTYKSDVYSKYGSRIRKIGDKYDAHHIKPLEYGGENSASNLTPLHAKDHYDHKGIHSRNGVYGEIKNAYYKGEI